MKINISLGMLFPDFENNVYLSLTGKATNYFNDDAQRIFPPFSRITVVEVTNIAQFVK